MDVVIQIGKLTIINARIIVVVALGLEADRGIMVVEAVLGIMVVVRMMVEIMVPIGMFLTISGIMMVILGVHMVNGIKALVHGTTMLVHEIIMVVHGIMGVIQVLLNILLLQTQALVFCHLHLWLH